MTCAGASGSNFKVGKTLVNCSAKDRSGNVTTKTFNVNVVYDQPKQDDAKDTGHDDHH